MTTLLGIIFDMDGVLCDSEPFIAAAAAEALRRRYGITVAREDFLPFVGAGDDRFITGAAALHGVTVDLAVDKALTYEIYLELIAVSLQPVAGVHSFLDEARAGGLRLAVATGSDRPKLNGNLAAIGVAESTFEVVISAEHVTHRKPDPETFLRAVERLGLPASRCLVVEDAPNGVRAGRAAGCPVLGITSSQPAEALLEEGAFAVAPDFTAVPADVRAALGMAPGPRPTSGPAAGMHPGMSPRSVE
jgi:cytidine deaminase